MRELTRDNPGFARRCGPHGALFDRLGEPNLPWRTRLRWSRPSKPMEPKGPRRTKGLRRSALRCYAQNSKARQTSLEWFENSARYAKLHPLQFSFSLMSRSKRVTYDNLAMRDPELVRRVRDWWAQEQGAPKLPMAHTPNPSSCPLRCANSSCTAASWFRPCVNTARRKGPLGIGTSCTWRAM